MHKNNILTHKLTKKHYEVKINFGSVSILYELDDNMNRVIDSNRYPNVAGDSFKTVVCNNDNLI